MLTREEAFELWAPRQSPWSVWTKPVLFAHLPRTLGAEGVPAQSIERGLWEPHATGSTLLVIDLQGARAIQLGEALVGVGFRPVPLFNAVPATEPTALPRGAAPRTLVDVLRLIHALEAATLRVREALRRLPATAPPAFLLHAERRHGLPSPGDFDNRSVSLPTDFPSAAFLQSSGITTALLVLEAGGPDRDGNQPSPDLAHTLLRWQNAGLAIRVCRVDAELRVSTVQPVVVRPPRWFRRLWYGVLATVGLRRHPLGGFGGTLPLPSSG
jgi:hypothetical protein